MHLWWVSSDAAGDIFFYVGDRLLTPMACREDPNWIMCKNAQVLDRDSVYTKTIVEADGSFGGCPSGDRTCTAYGAVVPHN